MKKWIQVIGCFWIAAVLLVMGCQRKPAKYITNRGDVGLEQAAVSAAKALNHLNAVNRSKNPVRIEPHQPNRLATGLEQLISVQWRGPVTPLLQRLANLSHYRLKVLGKEPALPILVAVEANNAPMAEILTTISGQAGQRAEITVYPTAKVIELRLAS